MNYTEILKEIIDITHQDYAGWEEKQGWDKPDLYIEKVEYLERQKKITPHTFTEIVSEYLLSFQDRHMYFLQKNTVNEKAKTCGFRVRRYKDTLYVTEAIEEKRFSKGTKITAIDGLSIKELLSSKGHLLGDSIAEREDWSPIINGASFIEIINNNKKTERVYLSRYSPIQRDASSSVKLLNEQTLLMTISSFENTVAIRDLVRDHQEALEICTNLIIDVRHNGGGNGQAYTTLMEYIFPKGESPRSELKQREFNCTERNSNLFIQLCRNVRRSTNDKGTLRVIEFAEENFQKYCGRGFFTFDFSDLLKQEIQEFKGKDTPKRVIVLSDSYCASAGEDFVETCKESSMVTVIGRSTMGVNDYSDLVVKTWNNQFSLYYPVSRLVKKTKKDSMHGKGVKPDHYIEWTPEHIHKDIDLLHALEFLKTGVPITG